MALDSPAPEGAARLGAPRSGGKTAVIMLAVGALLLAVAAAIHFWANGYVEACHRIAGEVGQAGSGELRSACGLMTAVWYGSALAMAASGVVVLYAAILWLRQVKGIRKE